MVSPHLIPDGMSLDIVQWLYGLSPCVCVESDLPDARVNFYFYTVTAGMLWFALYFPPVFYDCSQLAFSLMCFTEL